MATQFASFGTSPQSAVHQQITSKSNLKVANEASPSRVVVKKELFPTVATGSFPDAPVASPFETVADFYRFGQPSSTPGQQYERQPRTLVEADDERQTSSVRIFGRGPKDNKQRDFIPAYTKFFLESVSESHVERSQIVETFGNFYVFCFGERPPMYTFSGKLVNSRNANWVSDFNFMYDTYLRGTRCVELNARAIITYGGRQVEGLILSSSTGTQAMIEGSVEFQMQVVVFERKFLGFSDDFGFSTSDGENLKADDQFIKMLNQVTGGSQGTGTSNPGVSAAQGQVKRVMAGEPAAGLVSAIA